ncbi:FAD-dependent oxidoreductase [Cerasicoccus frondis]|uniref:FAD-dependent oxidoreductase n=1 Tax=Cerasicoccus frondis TaxID=490090 RepID=UPI002852A75C|nr:FAD-dependent oxidoreductase [Cerasicoccus frondis]
MISLSYPPIKSNSLIPDLYAESFDVVVNGAGYIGFAAAVKLAESGRKVLLCDAGGQLLWESTIALENTLVDGSFGSDWELFLQKLKSQSAVTDTCLDAACAEIFAARLLTQSDTITTLLYAMPVAVQYQDDALAAVIYATKEGFRRVRASSWVDATEDGSLLGCLPQSSEAPVRAPSCGYSRIVLQSTHWDELDGRYASFAEARGMRWLKAVRSTERQLVWEDAGEPWHNAVLSRLRDLRENVVADHCPLISHTSVTPFLTYESQEQSLPDGLPTNLMVLSPAFTGVALGGIAERHQWGASSVLSIKSGIGRDKLAILKDIKSAALPVQQQMQSDVLVAGAGTAGSLAILSAASQGANTLALEFAPLPGGIGAGGGITGYFYGLPGGRQEELGARTSTLTQLFLGDSYVDDGRSWHHEAKKIAILNEFDELGVQFFGNALLCDAELNEQSVESVLAVVNGKLTRIQAKAYVDSTGDGDLCSYAGASFTAGRVGDSRTLAFSQAAFTLVWENEDLTLRARNFDAGWVNATDACDLSRARLIGITQYHQEQWNESMLPLFFAPLLGIRESRHIATDYILEMDDLITQRQFDDSIGRAGAHADTHSVDFEFEDDETIFFYWVCRLFRYPLRAELPYRMLLPRSLANVWIACRAAGMRANVFYGIRMQRDMQRLGEAAGIAAALSVKDGAEGKSRNVSMEELRMAMEGAPQCPEDNPVTRSVEDPLKHLASGESGVPLWLIFRDPEQYRESVIKLLDSPTSNASFYAACILAMWRDELAESRLIQAIDVHEIGDTDPSENMGAYGQEIDIPFWLLSIILLRVCGSARCVSALVKTAKQPDNILNVRSALALTLERLVEREVVSKDDAITIIDHLSTPLTDSMLTPSHSIARTLRKQKQKRLTNHYLSPIRDEHAWQLHLVLCRVRLSLGLEPHDEALAYLQDKRNYVRQAFAAIGV